MRRVSNNKLNELFSAVEHNNLKCVKNWVEKYPKSLNIKGPEGDTALILAVGFKYFDMIKFLVENGANLNRKTPYGHTALHYAADSRNVDLDIIVYLIEKGADFSLETDDEETFYDYLSDDDKELLKKRLPKVVNELEAKQKDTLMK